MSRQTIETRYKGVQTFLTESCYFLSLLSIAEEYSGQKPGDLLDIIAYCKRQGYVTDDAFVKEPTQILRDLTGTHWVLVKTNKLPDYIPDLMYTVEKWQRDNYTHFKRRYVDTLQNSQTVAKGKLVEYYLFTAEK